MDSINVSRFILYVNLFKYELRLALTYEIENKNALIASRLNRLHALFLI